jgi:toxin ParE1/3/4
MSYTIQYSAEARQDLRDIFNYIALELLVPDTAKNQTRRIMDAVKSLDKMPMRYSLYKDEPWHSVGLRLLPVDNYVILYLPDEEKQIVSIVRIMYGGMDISKQLKETL